MLGERLENKLFAFALSRSTEDIINHYAKLPMLPKTVADL